MDDEDFFPRATIPQINLLLLNVKMKLSDEKFEFVERKINMDTLALLGMLPSNIIDELCELTYRNYCNGPTNDRNSNDKDCIWEFGKLIDNREIYIKIKNTEKVLITISFHEAERKLIYLYKED